MKSRRTSSIEMWSAPQPDAATLSTGRVPAAVELARSIAGKSQARRSMSWFLHSLAQRLGSFQAIANAIPEFVPHVLGTATMNALSPADRAAWTESTAATIDRELNGDPLDRALYFDYRSEDQRTPKSDEWPTSFRVAQELCAVKVSDSAAAIARYCNGTEDTSDQSCAGSTLSIVEILNEFRREWAARSLAQVADTSVKRDLFASLDYACSCEPGITLIQGDPRTGKTASTLAWCDANAHRARYLSLESTMTDRAFFADVSRALGNPPVVNYGTARMREEIRQILDSRDLLLVIDEGQQLWGNTRTAIPTKINWLMTALVNRGCSVALVVTPQFMGDLTRFESETAFAAAQWKGRIVNFSKLPSTLPADEVRNVAVHLLPEGDAEAIRVLVALAAASPSYLQAIRTAVSRARHHAKCDAVPVDTQHVKRAISEQLGLLEGLAEANQPERSKKPGQGRVSALPPQEPIASTPPEPAPASRLQGACSVAPETLSDRSRSVILQA